MAAQNELPPVRLLLVDPAPEPALLSRRGELAAQGVELSHARGLEAALGALAGGGIDVLLIDGLGEGEARVLGPASGRAALLTVGDGVEVSGEGARGRVSRAWLAGRGLLRVVGQAAARARREADTVGLAHARLARAQAEASTTRARMLAEASELLARSFEVDSTLPLIARLAAPALGDVCLIDVMDDEGAMHRVGEAGREGGAEIVAALSLHPPRASDEGDLLAAVHRTGKTLWLPEIGDETRAQLSRSPGGGELVARLAPRSLISAPMLAGARRIGVLTILVTRPGRELGEKDRAQIEELALRVALSIDSARLYVRAEQALRSRDQVLSVIAHDLRNPVSNILIASEILLSDGPSEVKTYLEVIRRAAKHMTRLISDFRDQSRLEGGPVPLERERHEGLSLVRDALELIAPAARERSIRLVEQVSEPLPVLSLDRGRVVQALSNMLDNAIRYSPVGAEVALRAEPREGEVWFSVKDAGSGVPIEQLPFVFRHPPRTGVRAGEQARSGLVFAKGVAEAHGGRIWVESEMGGGSTFTMALPLPPAPPGPKSGP